VCSAVTEPSPPIDETYISHRGSDLTGLPPDVYLQAAQVICGRAEDLSDAVLILDMLGLLPVLAKTS
jgi:hypothetical protein